MGWEATVALFGGRDEDPSGQPGGDAGSDASDRSEARPNTAAPAGAASTSKSPQRAAAKTQEGGYVTSIGKSVSIKGDRTGSEDIVVEGNVSGKIDLPNNELTIGSDGTVDAEVHAKSIVVVGRVKGNVAGTERIEIQDSGVVDGDVSAPRLVVAEGAIVNGSIQMTKSDKAPSAKPAREVASAAS